MEHMENKVVRKSNFLIEASYKLSLVEQRIVMVLASMITSSDGEFKKYSLNIKDFATLLELKHKDEYSQLQTITKRLLTRAFTVKMFGATLQVGWLSSAKYLDGQGIVELCFDPELKPFLLQLKERFTSYRLKDVIQLKSSFSIRIYELLKQYEKLGERTFLLEKLRECLGIDSSQYKLYGDFKRKILMVAKLELMEKTDILFDFEEIKVGRGVGKIRFIIKSRHLHLSKGIPAPVALIKELPNLFGEDSARDELSQLCKKLPIEYQNKESVRKLLSEFFEKHGFDYVARNIEFSNDGSNAVNPGVSLGRGSNYRNYLAKALKGDFGLPSREDQEIHQAQKEINRQAQEAAVLAARHAQEKSQMEQENKERARVYRQSLTLESQIALREEALSKMEPAKREAVIQKNIGSEILLKIAIDKLCLERMKLG
ncbi:MAG: replication initiation protein [Candidatus Ozemobacteraceae bacterium]|jgi:plasmid replication initiation protein